MLSPNCQSDLSHVRFGLLTPCKGIAAYIRYISMIVPIACSCPCHGPVVLNYPPQLIDEGKQ